MAEVSEENKATLVNEKNANGDCAIVCAAARNDLKIMKMLIDAGANLNVTSNAGKDLMYYATRNKNVEMTSLLNKSETSNNTSFIYFLLAFLLFTFYFFYDPRW